ncbi:MAG: TatD family hydrolase, partial [Bacteroidales bacterium]
MQLIDTHTHLYLPEFDVDRDEVVNRAVRSGVGKLLMPNIDVDSVSQMLSVERRYPGICYSMTGLHPTSVKEDFSSQIETLKELSVNHKFCAVGEIGIDLYWDQSTLKDQITAFKMQVAFAIESGLPVVIHSRNSFPEVFNVLEDFKGSVLRGVFHAFTGTLQDAEKAISMGFKLGIGGILTYKNSGLDTVIKETGPAHIILETDSPYLPPEPYRGKRNESSYLCIINNK